MATRKAYDEVLNELLLTIPQVTVTRNVFHLEQYQTLDTLVDAYPCIVFYLQEDVPALELSGDSQFRWATYTVDVISPDSADIRTIAALIKGCNDPTFNDALHLEFENIEWITVTYDVEASEFAIEQQEKGLKTATLTLTIHHWGDI